MTFYNKTNQTYVTLNFYNYFCHYTIVSKWN